MYEEIGNKTVTCRKPHVCCWCNESIKVGEKAQAREYKWEGEFTYDWMHPECYDAMLEDGDATSYGWGFGNNERGKIAEDE